MILKKILSECGVRTESDLTILNGSADGSNTGNYTYVSPTGCSVADYFVVSRNLIALSTCLNAGQRIQSKHDNNTELKRSRIFAIKSFNGITVQL